MVALDIINASNARLRELGPGLVALFVGGTSGIGEFTLKAFVQNATSPRVYLVGRNATAADRIIKECGTLNKDSKVEFLQADVTELKEVDQVCREIEKREKKINLIVQTQGNLTLNGRNESPEGIDRKFTLNYYSRIRFITNLLPLLRTATHEPPHFARTLSVLGAGSEKAMNLSDLDLKTSFSGARCANHTITMNSLMVGELAARDPNISFLHSFPGVVNTGIARELPLLLRGGLKVLLPLFSPFLVSPDETGKRQLFHATSGIYPPATLSEGDNLAGGVRVTDAKSVVKGLTGKLGSGAYVVNWNGDITGNESVLSDYREKGVGKMVWEHTLSIFNSVEKINEKRT